MGVSLPYAVGINIIAADDPECDQPNGCFHPKQFTINTEERHIVTWLNNAREPHTVTSGMPETGPDGLFDSGLMSNRDSFKTRFYEPGIYDYFCMVHPWETGQIIVEGDATPQPIKIPVQNDTEGIQLLKQQVIQLQEENDSLLAELAELRKSIDELTQHVSTLNEIILQQMQVIYTWVVTK